MMCHLNVRDQEALAVAASSSSACTTSPKAPTVTIQLSLAYFTVTVVHAITASDEKLGGAWERGYSNGTHLQ